MHTLFGKRICTHLLPVIIVFALTACGAETSQDGALTSDGSIVISPSALEIDLADPAGMAVCAPGSDVTFFPVHVSTFDGRGLPRGNVDIALVLEFAPNTSTQVAMSLYNDALIEVTSATSPLPFETETDEFGNETFFLLADTSIACDYSGSLTVISGSLVTTMQITATGS